MTSNVKNYDTITINVSPHPGVKGVFIVQAIRYEGDDWNQDDAEEIQGIDDALSYAVTNAEYYKSEYPNASVIVIDNEGSEYWPMQLGDVANGERIMNDAQIGQRALRPLREAITKEIQSTDTSTAWLIEYQPGNMTRYDVFFQKVSQGIAEAMGYGFGATLVVFCNLKDKPTLIIPDHAGHLSLSYFMEKTGISEGDAVALLPLVIDRLKLNQSYRG